MVEGLIWNSSWDFEGLSSWAVANKIASATTLPPAVVLTELVRATTATRIKVWADSKAAQGFSTVMGLSPKVAARRFVESSTNVDDNLRWRERYRLAVRWCPECLHYWYHTALFQDTRLRRCPWHGHLLNDHCVHCGRSIDPLGEDPGPRDPQPMQAWCCSACKKPIQRLPSDWLEDFKEDPGHDGKLPEGLALGARAYEELPDGGRRLHPDPRNERRHSAHRSGWLGTYYFEEAAALLDTWLAPHRECVDDQLSFEGTFKCPVAAAFEAVFTTFGVQMRHATWPSWKDREGFFDLPGLGARPHWQQALVARDIVKALLVHALELYADLALVNRRVRVWSVNDAPPLDLKELLPVGSKEVFDFPGFVRDSVLKSAVDRATRFCPRTTSQAHSRV